MNEQIPQDEQALRAELSLTREKLSGLLRELSGIDAELETAAPEQHQYRLLEQVCRSLESLEEVGGSALFWNGNVSQSMAHDQIRNARGRIDVFQKRIDEIGERRQSIVDEIERTEENADFLEDGIYEVEQAAEDKKLEWVVERDIDDLPIRPSYMPWSRGREDDERFRKNLGVALLLSLLLGVIFPMIDLPLPEAWEVDEVPERFTSLIKQEIVVPPPPPRVIEETQPEQKPEPVDELIAEEPAPKAAPKPDSTKKSAASKGILAFREKFSGLANDTPVAKLGAQATIKDAGSATVGLTQRSMVTTQAAGSSGGINLASLSRDSGGGGDGIAGVAVARATSSIGDGTGSDRPFSDGPGLSRTDEEIQIVFDRHKSALYRLYNRQLRNDPTLQGQMVLRFTIEPDGSVSMCELNSSDMNAPQLASQVVDRVRGFDFGAKEDISAITILYPIDFLPAS